MPSSEFTDIELWEYARGVVVLAAKKNPNLREEDIDRAADGLFNTLRAFENKK